MFECWDGGGREKERLSCEEQVDDDGPPARTARRPSLRRSLTLPPTLCRLPNAKVAGGFRVQFQACFRHPASSHHKTHASSPSWYTHAHQSIHNILSLISLGAHHRNMFNAVQLSVLDDPLVVPESIYCRVWRMNIITSFIAFHRRYYIVGEFFGCAITTSLRVFCSLLLYPKHLKSLSRSFNPMPNKPVSCNMHSKHNQTP